VFICFLRDTEGGKDLCIEPLLARVRVNCRDGLAPMIGLVAFADDVNVLLANAAQLKVHLDLVSQFTEVSGLDLNPSSVCWCRAVQPVATDRLSLQLPCAGQLLEC
jgi:hypothetical protein